MEIHTGGNITPYWPLCGENETILSRKFRPGRPAGVEKFSFRFPRSRDVGNRSDILILSVVNAAISEITSQKPYLGSADGKIYTREMILSELM